MQGAGAAQMNPPWPVVPRETKLTMPAIPMPSTAPNPALRINIAPAQSHPSAEAAAADNEARICSLLYSIQPRCVFMVLVHRGSFLRRVELSSRLHASRSFILRSTLSCSRTSSPLSLFC